MTDLLTLITHDAFASTIHYFSPRDLLLISMTSKSANQFFTDNPFWTHIYHTYFAAQLPDGSFRREYRELETKPKPFQLATRARYFCGLMSFRGCQNCNYRRIRKIYMPFMLRLCEVCFNDMTIQDRFICAATGFPSFDAIRELGVDLAAIPHRRSYYDFTW